MTNSAGNYILKSCNSAYFNELVPNAEAVWPLWFLRFILEFGEWSPEEGA
jgi:hypothetical protein